MIWQGKLKDGLARGVLGSESKLAFMFPGVGSEYTGMGKYVFDNFQCAREVFEQASGYANQDIEMLCFAPEESDSLGELANAKLAVVTTSLASSSVLINEFGITPDYCVGHSAGEYSALCCAGVLSLRDTVVLLGKRAETINSVLSEAAGTMAWAVNLASESVEKIIVSLQDEGHQVFISAYDSPNQTSISTTKNAFPCCAAAIENAGGILISINAFGPFHSPLMEKASTRFRQVLKGFDFGKPKYTVLANHDARPYTENRADTLENLSLHLVKPVQWRATIQCLLENRVRYAIDLGPKNILGYLLDKSTKEISGLSLDKEKSWADFRSDWVIDEGDVLRAIEKNLGAIASTKNECRDLDVYELEVVKPINFLKSLLEDLRLRKTPISKSHLELAIEITNSVLAAKQVPGGEIARRNTENPRSNLFE